MRGDREGGQGGGTGRGTGREDREGEQGGRQGGGTGRGDRKGEQGGRTGRGNREGGQCNLQVWRRLKGVYESECTKWHVFHCFCIKAPHVMGLHSVTLTLTLLIMITIYAGPKRAQGCFCDERYLCGSLLRPGRP